MKNQQVSIDALLAKEEIRELVLLYSRVVTYDMRGTRPYVLPAGAEAPAGGDPSYFLQGRIFARGPREPG
jgi:hypothetical protein